MSAEKFLTKFFEKLTKKDFESDEFLIGFYKFFKRTTTDELFKCYVDYLIRTREFKDNNERSIVLDGLYVEIRDAILYKEEDTDIKIGFVSSHERSASDVRHDVASKSDTSGASAPSGRFATETSGATINRMCRDDKSMSQTDLVEPGTTEPVVHSGPIRVNKSKAMRVLSTFIKQSFIVTYENPDDTATEQDQIFRDESVANIVDDIIRDRGSLHTAQKDIEFGQRVDMMNIWRDTEEKCNKMCHDDKINMLVSKLFFIDVMQLLQPQPQINTVVMEEINDLLPCETLQNCYTKAKYQTSVKLTNSSPVQETVSKAAQKIKTLYICTGSQMIQGGNADQGLNVMESMPWMTSTYSVGISRALHAYPLTINQALLCPNVLVFKDTKYNPLVMSKYQRISIMCAPGKWRPELTNPGIPDLSQVESHSYLYDTKTSYKSAATWTAAIKAISGFFEAALFFGYDTIVLDDRAIADNMAPAHLTAKMLREVITAFSGRFREIIIAVDRAASFNVFRHYFPVQAQV